MSTEKLSFEGIELTGIKEIVLVEETKGSGEKLFSAYYIKPETTYGYKKSTFGGVKTVTNIKDKKYWLSEQCCINNSSQFCFLTDSSLYYDYACSHIYKSKNKTEVFDFIKKEIERKIQNIKDKEAEKIVDTKNTILWP